MEERQEVESHGHNMVNYPQLAFLEYRYIHTPTTQGRTWGAQTHRHTHTHTEDSLCLLPIAQARLEAPSTSNRDVAQCDCAMLASALCVSTIFTSLGRAFKRQPRLHFIPGELKIPLLASKARERV